MRWTREDTTAACVLAAIGVALASSLIAETARRRLMGIEQAVAADNRAIALRQATPVLMSEPGGKYGWWCDADGNLRSTPLAEWRAANDRRQR